MVTSTTEYEPLVDILTDIFGQYKSHNPHGGQISFSCPVCSYDIKGLDKLDGKGNLEINYKMGVYKCWACAETHGTQGHLHRLIKRYGSKSDLKKFEILIPDFGDFTPYKFDKVRLPKEFVLFKTASSGIKITHHYKYAYNYLKSRNISDDTIFKHNMGFCYQGEYMNRIIIPSYDDFGDLNYFVGRSYEKYPKQKYKNPKAEKDNIIFNESSIDWDKTIYLVEGPFDSIFLENSIPLLGKVLDTEKLLFKKLYENARKIVVVLDGDAYSDAERIYNNLNGGRLFGKIWIVKLPEDKDIADLSGNLDQYPPYQID